MRPPANLKARHLQMGDVGRVALPRHCLLGWRSDANAGSDRCVAESALITRARSAVLRFWRKSVQGQKYRGLVLSQSNRIKTPASRSAFTGMAFAPIVSIVGGVRDIGHIIEQLAQTPVEPKACYPRKTEVRAQFAAASSAGSSHVSLPLQAGQTNTCRDHSLHGRGPSDTGSGRRREAARPGAS